MLSFRVKKKSSEPSSEKVEGVSADALRNTLKSPFKILNEYA